MPPWPPFFFAARGTTVISTALCTTSMYSLASWTLHLDPCYEEWHNRIAHNLVPSQGANKTDCWLHPPQQATPLEFERWLTVCDNRGALSARSGELKHLYTLQEPSKYSLSIQTESYGVGRHNLILQQQFHNSPSRSSENRAKFKVIWRLFCTTCWHSS